MRRASGTGGKNPPRCGCPSGPISACLGAGRKYSHCQHAGNLSPTAGAGSSRSSSAARACGGEGARISVTDSLWPIHCLSFGRSISMGSHGRRDLEHCSAWHGRLWVQELAVLEILPERRGDLHVQPAHVLLELAHRLRARNHADHGWMRHHELQSGACQLDAMRLAYLAERLDALAHRGRDFAVVKGDTTGEHAGVERATDDDAHLALKTLWEQGVERLLLEQRVAACQQEQIRVHQLQEPRARL